MDDAQICGYYVDDNSKGISYRKKVFIFVASVILSILSIIREGADAVDFRTQTKIKIYSFNFKDPSF